MVRMDCIQQAPPSTVRATFCHVFPTSFTDSEVSGHQRSANVSIANLPGDLLLEIFDSFRQTFQHDYYYERVWNSKRGWFKLAHVCQAWRLVVLTSPSRLHLRLLFTEHHDTTKRAIASATGHLPLLPIVVDYSNGAWTVETQNRMISALAYPDRVSSIAFRGREAGYKRLLTSINRPFPALESLRLDFQGLDHLPRYSPGLNRLPPFLRDNPLPVQRLTYIGRADPLLFQLLSHTKSLVEINVCVDSVLHLPQRSALFALLQDMPFLRRVNVNMSIAFPSVSESRLHGERRDVVLLSNLTDLRVIGPSTSVDAFFAELATPPLQEFHVSIHFDTSLCIPHLSKFIRNAQTSFFAVQLMQSQYGFRVSMLSLTHSMRDPSFNIAARGGFSIMQISVALSAMVATVEDVFFTSESSIIPTTPGPLLKDLGSWHAFFVHFRNVKILRVDYHLAMEIADILQHDAGQPTTDPPPAPENADLDTTTPSVAPNGSSQYTLGASVLPSLEEIEVYVSAAGTPTTSTESVSPLGLDMFKPVVTARQQMGLPVKVYWNADRVLPRYYCDANN